MANWPSVKDSFFYPIVNIEFYMFEVLLKILQSHRNQVLLFRVKLIPRLFIFSEELFWVTVPGIIQLTWADELRCKAIELENLEHWLIYRETSLIPSNLIVAHSQHL